MGVRVFIGDYKGTPRAFIEAERSDGVYRIAELLEFGMMSTFEVDGRNLSLVTMFDKSFDVAHFEVVPSSPRGNHVPRTDIPTDAKAPRFCGGHIMYNS